MMPATVRPLPSLDGRHAHPAVRNYAAFAEEHEDVPHSPRPIGEEEAKALALLHLIVPNGRD